MGILCSGKVYVYAKKKWLSRALSQSYLKGCLWVIILSLTEINLFSIPQKNSIISKM